MEDARVAQQAQEIARLQQLLEERERELGEERQLCQDLDRKLDEARQLLAGTYYSSIDEVWNTVSVGYTQDHWDALRRVTIPTVPGYEITVTSANDENNTARDEVDLAIFLN
jgi:hypothetical protein